MRNTRRIIAGATAGLILCAGAAVSARAGEPATVTYPASTQNIANPERGFYKHTETHYRADGSGYTPLSAQTLAGYREQGVTQVLRVFYLEKFASEPTLDQEYLDLVKADLDTAREAGVSVITRFAYAQGGDFPYSPPYGDAPLETVLAHIEQLEPVFHEYADVIPLVQQGFIGLWGEGYYTDHFAADPANPGVVTEADWRKRNAVVAALLAAVPDERMVAARTMFSKQQFTGTSQPLEEPFDGSDAARIGHHNDCFLASPDDFGTFLSNPLSLDQEYLEAETRYLPMGGETCAVNAPRSEWASASAEMARYHYSYLNRDYNTDVLDSWGADGLAETQRRLGYRFVATESTVTAKDDGSTQIWVGVRNDGWAAPYAERQARLVLTNGSTSHTVEFESDADVRTWAAGESVELTATVDGLPAGEYQVHLAIPAAQEAVADDPRFAIQLANEGTWDAQTGLNDLGQTVTVE
ncbi:DUF4832 domain-containing protein [Kineosporia babensis]|uniref:DUF4832 domain-containing protein n=1 Tax=Kineosporia babensis TaxID=499548 RepID=A0A9X1NDL9_9ACTN|nr:DUF4832 domain-containing protein [Kineosporia babensis]MCD5313217.1 DUF4832 domain-containing protein [Kineosporia babensis]